MDDGFEFDTEREFRELVDQCVNLSLNAPPLRDNARSSYNSVIFVRQILAGTTVLSICYPPVHDIPSLGGRGLGSDFPSGFLVVRGMYECFLEGHYILLDDEFEECRDVSILVARLHAQRERLDMARVGSSGEAQVNKEIRAVEGLTADICNHAEFSSLPERMRNYVGLGTGEKNRPWHGRRIDKLARRAGISSMRHDFFYTFCSNHSHANPYSLQQIGAVRSPEDVTRQLLPGLRAYTMRMLDFALYVFLKVRSLEGSAVALPQSLSDEIDYWRCIYSKPFGSEEECT